MPANRFTIKDNRKIIYGLTLAGVVFETIWSVNKFLIADRVKNWIKMNYGKDKREKNEEDLEGHHKPSE